MKKFSLLFAVLATILFSACSSTWEGVKEDSSNAWKSTKETVHEATAD